MLGVAAIFEFCGEENIPAGSPERSVIAWRSNHRQYGDAPSARELSAPTRRTADGKPDLSGIWFIDETPLGEYGERPLALRSEIRPEEIILTPEGQALQQL